MKAIFPALLLMATSLAQTAAPRPTVARMIGTWKLVSVNITMKDGTVRPDPKFGPHALGYIMYEPDGHMCAQIMNPDHMTWKDTDHPTDAERLASYDSMLSYCGTYKLDAEHSTVTHSPKVAWSPAYVGSTQPRPFQIQEKPHLLIITPPNPYPDATRWVLTWEKVS